MRKPIIAGNWKMNNTVRQGLDLVEALKEAAQTAPAEVCVCVPFTALSEIGKSLKGSAIGLGAQNMHFEEEGAFTGEISAAMLTELGTRYVVIGHSERRMYYNESDRSVNLKIRATLDAEMIPIFCVGESLDIREQGMAKPWVKEQVVNGLANISAEEVSRMAIAYEPIWAIGTGKTASDDQAEEMCAYIRNLLEQLYDDETADRVRVLYGGSVKKDNIDGLMAMANIDGALVGGASLKAGDFARIMNFEEK